MTWWSGRDMFSIGRRGPEMQYKLSNNNNNINNNNIHEIMNMNER